MSFLSPSSSNVVLVLLPTFTSLPSVDASTGVLVRSLAKMKSVLHAVNLQWAIATIDGQRPCLDQENQENNATWLRQNQDLFTLPQPLNEVHEREYCALVIPHSLAAASEFAQNSTLSQLLQDFVAHRKPILTAGYGASALCGPALGQDKPWLFVGFNMTGTPIVEEARESYFGSLPLILEEEILNRGGNFSCSEPDSIHVVIDRFLITAQNENSFLLGVKNLCWLCTQR
eukprot:GILJ01015533.1.p1 GENE.GILJ01015533.1~~GILJ01015533.1.p1  ORF type:complete len:230 (-),score=24.12 GILJ01015533.1:129-818(-)